MAEHFDHRPQDYVGTSVPGLVYVGFANRQAFDRITLPMVDHGENDDGHVLTKSLEADGCRVVFQYWIKSLTAEGFLARRAIAKAERGEQ